MCIRDSLEACKYLLSQGFDINTLNEEGNTPLYVAYKADAVEVIPYFVENGANTDIKNSEGLACVHLATAHLTRLMNKFFQKDGCNLQAKLTLEKQDTEPNDAETEENKGSKSFIQSLFNSCLLYTSPSPRD